ncbi:C4-dicarboxylate ABC transporter permease [Marinomonas ushuaiensis DSM 15871]|uniref:TRAP transporter small permease protein n=1 Tax=Marinomonas ushuaiensis DSM 15871 TaxID=1122207 RepID=X7E1I7_9GAMM|nr:TRAP transporter small permease subunit [Marinomonas ushuaiensis]ETX09730.1 C4-dicarboxylate ABC transporter permease [Marinomonas ushuaiensis DSM 15871]
MKSLIQFIEKVVEGFGGLARLCVLALVLLVATNVIFRYLFSIGPVSLQELEWHLISPIALIGLAYSMKHRADVRVDIFYDKFSIRKQGVIDLLTAVATIAIGLYITWLSIKYVGQSYRLQEGSPDPGGLPMRYLLKAFIPIGFGLLVFQGIADTLTAYLKITETKNEAIKIAEREAI